MILSPALDELATKQHGLLSGAQLRQEFTKPAVQSAARNGYLLPVRRGV